MKPTETQFRNSIIALAQWSGWLCYYVPDSRKVSSAGFPDLTLLKHRFLLVELKTDKGRLSEEQRTWLRLASEAGIDARVWRPGDWSEIETLLKGAT